MMLDIGSGEVIGIVTVSAVAALGVWALV